MVLKNEKPGARPGLLDADLRHPHRSPFIVPDARERMADFSAWRELAAQSRKLADIDGNMLCAHWNSSGFNGPSDRWQLSGTTNDYVHQQFRWYAERAAVLLGESIETATLFFWLDRLR